MLNKPLRLFTKFIHAESSGGVVMLAFAALAMMVANSGMAESYAAFVAFPLTIGSMSEPLNAWVKDVLMVLFFLLVGMELKREMKEGLLSQKGQVMMPLLAAVAGMAVPAAIFCFFNAGTDALHGWAIPSATDIAFALCILMLFGKTAPVSAKIVLLAIAIFDDLGAILIIAFFYNSSIALVPLALTVAGIVALAVLNRFKVSALLPYLLVGVYLWFCLHAAGIHTTIAGVLVGMAIPMRDAKNSNDSPLNKCMHFLHPWVSFCVLPIFAFTSAGIDFSDTQPSDLLAPLPLGIALGLFAGKQVGIFGVIFMLVKSGLAKLPEGANWLHIYAVSVLAGIGFTMSLFISLLAFADPHVQDMAKTGVIAGSLASAVLGAVLLNLAARKERHGRN